jgi:UDP-N-acetylglucosamine--N-acetylmuramyl-(pentapeptide) pyrophosphoryl-undecaprenol N-acetylglucosamine transferase
VLIFGGSQGAHAINMAMVAAAERLAAAGDRVAITHQTGARDLDLVRDAYRRSGLDARVEAFLYEMHREMTDADLVVSRAGATTVAELAAAGRTAILVPLPTAADDHQRKNAQVMERLGAALYLDERELTGERLAHEILALAGDRPRRSAMARAARAQARPDAARRIADRVWTLAGTAGRAR